MSEFDGPLSFCDTDWPDDPPCDVENRVDEDGRVMGGHFKGPGINIEWQDGPRGRASDGSLNPATGALVPDVIRAVLQRVEFFQRDEMFACIENENIISYLRDAIDECENRERRRGNATGTLERVEGDGMEGSE